MTSKTNNDLPKLRALDFRPIVQNERPMLLLRDPLQLSDLMVAVPQQLAPVLALCDGTHDAEALRAECIAKFQVLVGTDLINRLITACNQAYLLENDKYREACQRRLAEYRAATFRPPALADQSYPGNPHELQAMLDGYLAEVIEGDHDDHAWLKEVGARFADGRGLVSPHIDYQRGGPVYATVWKGAEEMVRAADLAVILGTDHYGGHGKLTLTRQNYATPFGVLPTATPVVEALAEAIGVDAAYAEELHHRNEHSIELAAVWLHHTRGGRPCEVVPVLCGSFAHYVAGLVDPARDPVIDRFISALRRSTEGRRVIVIAAGDLAHVGPAFGGKPHGALECARLHEADDEIIGRMCAGDAEGFFQAIRRVGDRNNVCGLPPIYLALRMLGEVQGEHLAYDRCSADEQEASWVSIGGILFK